MAAGASFRLGMRVCGCFPAPRRRASHARGRWFEPSRAHPEAFVRAKNRVSRACVVQKPVANLLCIGSKAAGRKSQRQADGGFEQCERAGRCIGGPDRTFVSWPRPRRKFQSSASEPGGAASSGACGLRASYDRAVSDGGAPASRARRVAADRGGACRSSSWGSPQGARRVPRDRHWRVPIRKCC